MSKNFHYPTQQLLFFVADNPDDSVRSPIKQLLEDLGTGREWTIRPPEFVDDIESPSNPGDLPIRTIGGLLEIYSAHGTGPLPLAIDRSNLEDVTYLVDVLKSSSARWHLSFELELDGSYVGEISEGSGDRSLEEGLLGEWRRHLGV